MTQYQVVDTNPISIYPGGKQGQVAVYNSGANTVWVNQAASNIDGIPILGGNSVQWNSLTPLYAYVQDAALPTSVIVIDSGVTLPNGTISVNGPVAVSSIGTPVSVQGGGDLLCSGILNIGALGTATIDVPLPANGLTYYGVRVQLSVTGVGTGITWASSDGLNTIPVGSLICDAGPVYPYGYENTTFFAPVISAFPLQLTLNEGRGVAATVYYNVRGMSTGPVSPVTDITQNVGQYGPLATGNTVLNIPASYTPYRIYIRTGAGTSFNDFNVYEFFNTIWQLTRVSPLGPVSANAIVQFDTAGSGLATQLRFSTIAGSALYIAIGKIG